MLLGNNKQFSTETSGHVGTAGTPAQLGRQPRGAPPLWSRWLLPARAGGQGPAPSRGIENPNRDRGDGRSPVGGLAAGPGLHV